MAAEVKHPADEIGKALARASGILAVLSSCYDKQTQSFETGSNYAYESILAIENIVMNASGALVKLYGCYDLTPIGDDVGGELPSEVAISNRAAMQVEASSHNGSTGRASQNQKTDAANLNGYLSSFGPAENASHLAERADYGLSQPFTFDLQIGRGASSDRRAESYDELLQKLTTVAHQAAAFEHQPGFEEKLLPALEDLRADILRLRSAA